MVQLRDCPLCGKRDIRICFARVKVWKCNQCGLLFRNPQPESAELDQLYESHYTPSNIAAGKTEMAATTFELARRYADCLWNELELTGKKVLEFGAGLGSFAAALRERGADVAAVEPYAYDACRNAGITTYRTLEEIPKEVRFDVAVMVDVAEHLARPRDTFGRLRELLHPGGWLYVSTLTVSGLNARVTGGRWREITKPSHLVFFTPKTLEHTLQAAGFGRFTRLKWYVRYSSNPLRRIEHFLLQASQLDGELRYLAQRS
jgi:2-polyprenyl-3-methyl-5-hydroxy-6-metoxy-1,4-benzoquinol methylase